MTGIIVTIPPTVELPPGSSGAGPVSLPGVTYTYAVLTIPQTWTAAQTFNANCIVLNGTGGTSQVLRQSSLNAPVTVGQLAFTDISGQGSLTQLPTIGANTVLGSIAGGTPIALSTAQHTSLVNAFTSGLSGAVPASGGGTVNFLRADGTFAAPGGAGTVTNVATTYPLSGGPITTTGTVTSVAPFACGRLTFVSTTAVKFSPLNGDAIKINGVVYQVPAAGIAGVANTSVFVNGTGASNLAASTFYYVYAFINSSTVTADFRTDGNGHLPSDTSGNIGTEVRVSSGTTKDDTRTLIGFIRTNGSSQFADSETQRFVWSWFNRPPLSLSNAFTVNRSTTSNTYVEINTEIRCEFLIGTGGVLDMSANGIFYTSSAGSSAYFSAITIDGATPATTGGSASIHGEMFAPSSINTFLSQNIKFTGLSEGYHYATIAGHSTAGNTTTWGDHSAGVDVTLKGIVQ